MSPTPRPRLVVRAAVSLAVVLSAAAVGLGYPVPSPADPSAVVAPLTDGPTVHQVKTVASSAAVAALTRLEPLATHVAGAVRHAPELLLVVELGLLVEHLRLLNRVGESVGGGPGEGVGDDPAAEEAGDGRP